MRLMPYSPTPKLNPSRTAAKDMQHTHTHTHTLSRPSRQVPGASSPVGIGEQRNGLRTCINFCIEGVWLGELTN